MSCICILALLADGRWGKPSFLRVHHVRVPHIRPIRRSTDRSYDLLLLAKPLPLFWSVWLLAERFALGWCLLVEAVLAIATEEF